jgi:hypothetical protein
MITISKTDADHVSVTVVANLGGWIDAEIHVSADPWSGTTRAYFHPGELRQFAVAIEKLYGDLACAVDFSPMEPYLSLMVKGDGRGHVHVEGKAQDRLSATET